MSRVFPPRLARLLARAQSQIANRKSQMAFTLIEMLTTVAVLVIVLGLMVSLARQVREQSAIQLTRELLLKLDRVMAQYAARNAGQLPEASPLIATPGAVDEPLLQQAARTNNAQFLAALRRQEDLSAKEFSDLPISIYDEVTLRDAWGTPIVFMPPRALNVGMKPQDRFFFFSAGPDRRFLTREDNLYSYEGGGG